MGGRQSKGISQKAFVPFDCRENINRKETPLMNGEFIIIALVAAAAVLVLLIVKLASFLRIFMEDAQYICHEMDCAHSYGEYRC